MVFSVRLSFWLCSHHRIIMKFSGVITKDQGKVHAKDQGQRSKVQVTEVTTQLNRFRTVTPVWIHIWWWNDTCSLMLLRRGVLPGGVLPMWWVIHMCRGFDPLFSLWQDRARSFWGIFLIHQQQSYLLGYKNYQFLQKSIFLAPNSIFSSIFLGPIFSGTPPSVFRPSTPPPPGVSYCFSRSSVKFQGHTALKIVKFHSGETDEANCSWLHQVWPPPKRPDKDNTFCVVSRASTELIFCIHRDFVVRNNVYKPRRLVCQCSRDISAWKSRVMKPTVLRDPGRMKPTEYRDEANWFSNWTDEANCW